MKNLFTYTLTLLLLSLSSMPVLACSHNKLDLDYCGDTHNQPSQQTPLYKPDFSDPKLPSLPDTHPTVVRVMDSQGKVHYGPGIQTKF